jgi:hypothetical protein
MFATSRRTASDWLSEPASNDLLANNIASNAAQQRPKKARMARISCQLDSYPIIIGMNAFGHLDMIPLI